MEREREGLAYWAVVITHLPRLKLWAETDSYELSSTAAAQPSTLNLRSQSLDTCARSPALERERERDRQRQRESETEREGRGQVDLVGRPGFRVYELCVRG